MSLTAGFYLSDIVVYSKDWLIHQSPVFSAPNFSLPFKLEVDASAIGAGAMLLQEDNQEIYHAVSFFSRIFDRHQLRYSTIEKRLMLPCTVLTNFLYYRQISPLF